MVRTKQTRQRSSGDPNKLSIADKSVHGWYRFVLSFPPHLVREYLERFGLDRRHCVLDPFCGTGTTLVECKKLGIPGVGVESNPMAHFATHVKTDWSPSPDGLEKHAHTIAKRTWERLEAEGYPDEQALPLFDTESQNGRHAASSELARLSEAQEKLLLRDSISPLPLHKTLVLLECLKTRSDDRYTGHERLALANALVHTISNLHFGPEVGVGRAKPDAPVVRSWLKEVKTIADDLREVTKLPDSPSQIFHADARHFADLIESRSINGVITSPPYPNEKDYTRTTRLESVLLGFLNDKTDLRALKEGLLRSNTRNVFKGDQDDEWVSENPAIQSIAEKIEARRIELGKTSGFERMYHRVTKHYFGGMAKHFAELREVLRPGAQLAYVVGDQASYLRIMIRTGKLLGDIAESLGYELTGIDLFRTRLATATKAKLREEVVVLKWPG